MEVSLEILISCSWFSTTVCDILGYRLWLTIHELD